MKGEFMPVSCCLVVLVSSPWVAPGYEMSLSLVQGCKGISDVWRKGVQKFCFLDGLVSTNWRCLHTDIPSWASHPGPLLHAEHFHHDSPLGIYCIQGKLQCSNTHFSILAIMSPHLFAYKYHPPPQMNLRVLDPVMFWLLVLGWISRSWLSILQLLGSSFVLIYGSWLLFHLVLARVLWHHDHWRWGCCNWSNTWWH